MSEENTFSETDAKTKKSRSGGRPKRDDSIWRQDEEEEEPNFRYTAALKAVQAASGEVSTGTTAGPPAGKEIRATAEREIGGTPFRDAYLTKSVHFIPEVWEAFKQLRPDTGKSLTKLQNEAMAWLLIKYDAMTPELRALFEAFRIEVPPSE